MRSGKDSKKAIALCRDASFQGLLIEALSRIGYETLSCAEPSEFWDVFENEGPRLVVLDWDTNECESLELCKRIRSHPSGRYVAVLVTDSSLRPEGMEEALRSGTNLYMVRTSSPDLIRGWVSAAHKCVEDLTDLQRSREKTQAFAEELDFTNAQLEEALTKVNRLAVEAELNYLELDQIFQSAASGIVVMNTDLVVLRHNRAFLKMADRSLNEIRGKRCHEVFHSPFCHTRDCPASQVISGSSHVEKEIEKRLPDGSSAFYMVTATPLRFTGEDLIAVVLNLVDITDRVKAEAALRKSEERFRVVADKAPFAQSLLKADHSFEYVNPKFTEMFGYAIQDVPDEWTWLEKAYPERDYRQSVAAALERRLKQSGADGELVFKVMCKDGSEKLIDFREVSLDNGLRVITYLDVTQRVKAEEALRHSERRYMELSIIDDLTRLYNKRHLNERLWTEIQRSVRYEHPLSILLLDIDDFKKYNDAFGHTMGDLVLAKMGEVIEIGIRQTDSAYRYGGEEFVVVLPETPGEAAGRVAERIRTRFEAHPFRPALGMEVHKTVSIGVAQYSPGEPLTTLLSRADENMYLAKRSGKNRVIFA